MRSFTACVRSGRIVFDEPTDLAEGTLLELVPVDDIDSGDPLDAEERAELERHLEASFAQEESGELIAAADVIAELRAVRADQRGPIGGSAVARVGVRNWQR
jgi:hypothetical protein